MRWWTDCTDKRDDSVEPLASSYVELTHIPERAFDVIMRVPPLVLAVIQLRCAGRERDAARRSLVSLSLTLTLEHLRSLTW